MLNQGLTGLQGSRRRSLLSGRGNRHDSRRLFRRPRGTVRRPTHKVGHAITLKDTSTMRIRHTYTNALSHTSAQVCTRVPKSKCSSSCSMSARAGRRWRCRQECDIVMSRPDLRLKVPYLISWGIIASWHAITSAAGKPYHVDPVVVEMAHHYWYVDSSAAKRVLGFKPRPWRATLRDTLIYIRDFGHTMSLPKGVPHMPLLSRSKL